MTFGTRNHVIVYKVLISFAPTVINTFQQVATQCHRVRNFRTTVIVRLMWQFIIARIYTISTLFDTFLSLLVHLQQVQ